MNGGENKAGWSNFQLIGVALLLFVASCVFHLKNARAGHPIYRDQHLGTALEYAKGRIDLFNPVIVGFNATGTPTPQELPVWQALSGIAFKLFGTWYGWANVISLLLFATCLFPLFGLARMFMGERIACWTLIFFMAQPLIFVYAGEASPDGFSLVVEIWFLYFAAKMLRSPTLFWWLPTCLIGTLAALTKLPFLMAAGLTSLFLLLTMHRSSIRAWVLLGSAGAVMIGVFFLWTAHTNHCIAIAEFPFVDLRLSDPEMRFWYFGDLHYRLSPFNWFKGGWRILTGCFGSFALIGLCIYGCFMVGQNALARFILLGAVLTTMLFTHLVLHHSHYYLMFTPAFAILCAQAAAVWETKLVPGQPWKQNLLLATVMAMLGLSVLQGIMEMKIVLDFDPFPYDMSGVIDKYTASSDKLLIEGGGWGGNELFLSHRQGMSIWNTKIFENPEHYKRLKELGYNKLVMISDPPLLIAFQMINPGQSKLQRQSYRQFMTAIVNDWPTVYQDDDILIKSIP